MTGKEGSIVLRAVGEGEEGAADGSIVLRAGEGAAEGPQKEPSAQVGTGASELIILIILSILSLPSSPSVFASSNNSLLSRTCFSPSPDWNAFRFFNAERKRERERDQ